MKRIIAFTFVFFALSLSAASDRWWEPYKRGTQAAQTNDWNTVSSEMQKSIAVKPQEELAAKARNEILVYVPHFWLGLARFQLGDTNGALSEWQISQSQGVVQKTRYYSDLRAWLSRAEAQKVKSEKQQSAGNRSAADSALSKALGGQIEAVSAGADRTDSFRAAKKKLDEALDLHKRAGNDPSGYDAARTTAQQALEMFLASARESQLKKVAARAQQRPAAAAPTQRPAIVRKDPAPVVTQAMIPSPAAATPQVSVTIAPQPVAEEPAPSQVAIQVSPEPQVESEALAATRIAVQQHKRRLSEIRAKSKDRGVSAFVRLSFDLVNQWDQRLRGTPSESELREIAAEIQTSRRDLDGLLNGGAPATVEPQLANKKESDARGGLHAAYIALAKSDLDEADQRLAALISSGDRSGEALLLRGCVQYTRAMLNHKPQLLKRADSDFQGALALNPGVRLDASAFSPKLVKYFNDLRRKPASR